MARKFEGIWIPASLWFSKELNITEKVIYLEVKSLDNDFGCTATNKKIGEVLDLKPATVSSILGSLEKKEFINIDYKDYNTFSGRVITIKRTFFGDPPLESMGVQKESMAPPLESIHSNTISNTSSDVDVDKSTSKSELSAKEKCQLFIHSYNKIRGTKNKPNTKVCGQLSARLKDGYTSKDIFSALRNMMSDDFHKENNYKHITPEFLLRVDKLDKFLNINNGVPAPQRKLVQ